MKNFFIFFMIFWLFLSCSIPFSKEENFVREIPAINIGSGSIPISIDVPLPDILRKYNITLEKAELYYKAANSTDYDSDSEIILSNAGENPALDEIITLAVPANTTTDEKNFESGVIKTAVNNKDPKIIITFKNSMGSVSIPGYSEKALTFSGKLRIKGYLHIGKK